MAGDAARHMRQRDGGRRGPRSVGPHRHRAVVVLVLVLASAALGAAALGIRGGADRTGEPGTSAAVSANSEARESANAGNEGAAAQNDSLAAPGNGDGSGDEDASAANAVAVGPGDSDDGQGEAAEAADETATASQVQSAVEPLLANASGTVSVAYVSLSHASDACYLQADRQERSASMIKLVILAEYLREVDAGTLSGGESYTLKASDIVGGTGSLQGKGAGYSTTLDDLARLMICESDNVAANVLIDRMGMDAVNAEASSLGLTSTVLERKMMDSSAMAAGRDNYTSARDVARVLELIGTGGLVSREASARALGWLEQQSDRAGIPAGLPSGTTVGNKTGSLEAARHDGAIVLGEHPYVLVVMTDGMGTDAANALIAQVSRATWGAVA